jgi:hypothetical protein
MDGTRSAEQNDGPDTHLVLPDAQFSALRALASR